uniref:Snaclec coagulation factor IX/factor X-binding protein subunit A n=2 Tax=Protobothrops flavoviridis TaxID=88087 RepID=SL9A_PROFL|nr:RecName: Full=Snaclec coagulation factor IX/factor X-binding protein subunit A; Short=IX/X-bp subunit A; Flags: Precursor [Protobothrops flavoviridis]BAA11887.1 factor IX/factor X binding protein A chain [Protobothrops flavoviridis]
MGRFIFMSFGLLVVAASLRGTGADCLSGWSSYEGHCYKAFEKYKTWEDAERVCTEQAKGAHLVSIESSGEADFVAQLVTQNMKRLDFYIWIGLRVQGKVKQCNSEWSDGSSVSYENWIEAESKTCLGLEKETDFRKWVNIYCGQQNPFVCEA